MTRSAERALLDLPPHILAAQLPRYPEAACRWLALKYVGAGHEGWRTKKADRECIQQHLAAVGDQGLDTIAEVALDYKGRDSEAVSSRAGLCRVIGSIGGPRAVAHLRRLWDHESNVGEYEWVRRAAAKALVPLLPPEERSADLVCAYARSEADPWRKTQLYEAVFHQWPDVPPARKHYAFFDVGYAWEEAGEPSRARYYFAQALLSVQHDAEFRAREQLYWERTGVDEDDWDGLRTLAEALAGSRVPPTMDPSEHIEPMPAGTEQSTPSDDPHEPGVDEAHLQEILKEHFDDDIEVEFVARDGSADDPEPDVTPPPEEPHKTP